MEGIPLHQKPSFRILILAIILAGLYLYVFVWRGGILANISGLVFDGILLLVLVPAAVFFHAQFTLPVRTARERLKISTRLWLHWRHAHGPAIFVKDGREIARAGETERRGPGVIRIDTASAAVTWTSLGRKAVLGPGVHFTEDGQRVGRTFSLHTQSCHLGPAPEQPVFARLGEQASDEQRGRYTALQASRTSVSGRTRDGNEVVPNVTVIFHLDSNAVRGEGPGSRFGFSAEAVERASRAEGINADLNAGEQSRVAWNQLPGLLAIDVWREYLSKFTLDELFSPTFQALPHVPQPAEPPPALELPSTPLITKRGLFVRLLRQRNAAFEKWLDHRGIGTAGTASGPAAPRLRDLPPHEDDRRYTALQIIGQIVQLRMTQAVVPILDECGRLVEGHTVSPEFGRLKERGLAVKSVTIDNVRFDPSVESQITQLWNTAWLANAEAERLQVEQLERLAGQGGRQKALVQHALALSQVIRQEKPQDMDAAARSLLRATQSEIVSDPRLYARAKTEVDTVLGMIRWVESGQHD